MITYDVMMIYSNVPASCHHIAQIMVVDTHNRETFVLNGCIFSVIMRT